MTACGPANYAEILIARFDKPLAGAPYLLPSFPLLPPARGLSNVTPAAKPDLTEVGSRGQPPRPTAAITRPRRRRPGSGSPNAPAHLQGRSEAEDM